MSRWLGGKAKRDDDKSLKCDNMELWQENDVTQNRRDRKGGKNWRNYVMENERGESHLGRSDIAFQRKTRYVASHYTVWDIKKLTRADHLLFNSRSACSNLRVFSPFVGEKRV